MSGRRAVERAALGIGGAVSIYLGWDSALWDPRFQLALHLAAALAIGGLLVHAWRGGALPRTPIDTPVLLLLIAFGAASIWAWNGGLSARAFAAVLATAAMLPLALLALRHRPGWTAAVAIVPIIGLAGGALAVLAMRRLEWMAAGGPGLPPLRLFNEGTPFGSVAVPPFVIIAALPLALLVDHHRLRRWLLAGLVAVGVPLTVLSGSRSAWIAIAVAGVVLAASHASAIRDWRWTPRLALAAATGLVGLALVAVAAAPRLLEAESLAYRAYLWRDTLAAWGADPLTGVGPGAMPYARQAAAPALSFPVAQPHSHDIPIGILGEAGVVGLLAAVVLVVAFVRVGGPWRTRTLAGRAAFAVLAGTAAGMLFEDLTFLPNYNLLLIGLVAIVLTDAGAVTWRPVALRAPAGLAAGAAAVALLAVMTLGDASAIAYRAGTDAAAAGDWPAAESWLATAVALDPLHPTGVKSLTLAAERNGHPDVARRAAERAVALNPGDAASWLNLALLTDDPDDVRWAAEQAIRYAVPGPTLANTALVLERLDDADRADAAYRLSLLTNPFTALALPWPRRVDLSGADAPELSVATLELNLVIARRAQGEDVEPEAYASPLAAALAHAMRGDEADARAALERAIAEAPASPTTWAIAALLLAHWGDDPSHAERMVEVIRGGPLASAAPQLPRVVNDIASFRSYPANGLVSTADPLLPDAAWPWSLAGLLE